MTNSTESFHNLFVFMGLLAAENAIDWHPGEHFQFARHMASLSLSREEEEFAYFIGILLPDAFAGLIGHSQFSGEWEEY